MIESDAGKMNSDTLLDFAQFQLSSCRTRCVLFVSSDGKTEKIASGFLKPFLTHLKVAEEQANQSVQLIQLEVEKGKNAANWFNKGTLERFVRFVSTPEILEAVNTFDAEMSQLEGARKIYSQGSGSQRSSEKGENESFAIAAADSTKKELLRAIDVRLAAVKQDLATACSRASSAGFSLNAVSDLLLFANKFGAHRLREACTKFIALCHNRPDLITHQRVPSQTSHQLKSTENSKLRSSSDSDMSIDEPEVDPTPSLIKPSTSEPSQKPTTETNNTTDNMSTQQVAFGSRRLSVQDRINLFESKKKEQSTSASSSSSVGGGISKVAVVKGEHRRQPSDASVEKSVLRRWSGASDMSIDATSNNSSFASAVGTPTSSMNSQAQPSGSRTEVFKDVVTSLPKLDSRDSLMRSSSSSSLSHDQTKASISEDKTHHSGFNSNTDALGSSDSTLESEDNTKVTNKKAHSTISDKAVPIISEGTSTQANNQGPSVTNFKTLERKTTDDTTISKVPLESRVQSQSSLGKAESSSKQGNSETLLNVHTRNKEAVKNEEATAIQSSLKVPTDGGNYSQRKQLNQGTNIPVFPLKKNKELNAQPISTLPAQKAQATNDDLQMKADELEKLFAAHKLRVHGDQTTSPRRNKTKTSGLEAQKSTLKMQPEVVQSGHFSAGEEFDPDLLRKLAYNLDSTDNMKPKLGEFSPSDEYRGKLYSKYMQKRDEKLREEQGSKSAEKEAKLKAMQENLERSQAEMKAKFAKSVTRSRAERMRSFNVRSSLKTKGQTIDLFHGEGEDTLARSYSDTLSGNESTTSSKKLSSNKSLLSSSTARTSSIPKPNVKAPNSNSIRRRDHISENPLAQSVPNFSDLRKENTKPAVRDEKSRRPSMRKSLGSPNDIVNESKPFLRKSNGRNPNVASLKTKSKTSTNLKSQKEEEFSESSPHVVKEKEEDFDRTSASEVPVESESENDYVTVAESQDMDDSITEYSSKPNHSFSYVNEASDIDASVDSPIGSPASWNSHPLNQMMEADTARMRKKWGSAQIPVIVANAPQNARKDVTKGFKRFLKFGRKGRGSDYLVNDWVSASTASEGDDDMEDGRDLGSRTSDELRKSRMGYINYSSYSFNGGDSFPEQVQSFQSSIPDAPTNFKFRDDPLSGNSTKAPRSFFSLSSFRSKVNEAKPR